MIGHTDEIAQLRLDLANARGAHDATVASRNRLAAQVVAVRALANEWTDEAARLSGTPNTPGKPVAQHLLGKHAADVRALLDGSAGSPETPAAEPGYQRIADAIENVCDAAELQMRLHFRGEGGGRAEPYRVLARLLDKAGLIDWSAFAAGSPETGDTEPGAKAEYAATVMARLRELDGESEANPDPNPLGDPVQLIGRYRMARGGDTTPPDPAAANLSITPTTVRWFDSAGQEIPAPKDGYSDEQFRRASTAVARCFAAGAEVEPTRSREFFNEIAHSVLAAALAGTAPTPQPAPSGPACGHWTPDAAGEPVSTPVLGCITCQAWPSRPAPGLGVGR